MKFVWISLIVLVAIPVASWAQTRSVSQQNYWSAIRDADDRTDVLPHRKVTTSSVLTGIEKKISRKDVVEYLPPDREKFVRTTYKDGKASTFELIKLGGDHYCRDAGGSWVKSKTWCGPNEMYSDPASSDTVTTVEVIGRDKKVEHYRYYSTYPSWNSQDDRKGFTEINTWIDSQKRVMRSETRRGTVNSDEPIYVMSEEYEYEPFKSALQIKAPTNIKRGLR
jgi:hypothetical protein